MQGPCLGGDAIQKTAVVGRWTRRRGRCLGNIRINRCCFLSRFRTVTLIFESMSLNTGKQNRQIGY
jgi:hypothetical protein